jgi:lysine 2,3-aminomutase
MFSDFYFSPTAINMNSRRTNKRKPRWQVLLERSLTGTHDLASFTEVEENPIQEIIARYPMRINPYYLSLIRHKGDPIYRQCVPYPDEITDARGFEDPLNEEGLSPVLGLTHRYPDRVLFLVSSQCAVYCRFCNRKRKVGRASMVTPKSIREGLHYIKCHKEIRDVLLSGGDPLLLPDEEIIQILDQLRGMSHVEIIRVGTRVPCTLPQRVTSKLAKILARYSPLYVHTHFNHPSEITEASSVACNRLANAGIPLGCQTVLLKGVNDDTTILRQLFQKLLTVRVRPYYLFQADLARGTSHFWTPLRKGLDIIKSLQGHTSGLCLPHFAIDLPGGKGKVPLLPDYITEKHDDHLLIKTYQGSLERYPLYDV